MCYPREGRVRTINERLVPARLLTGNVARLRAELALALELGVLRHGHLSLGGDAALLLSLHERVRVVHAGRVVGRLLGRLNRPVEDVVVLEALANEEVAEELAEVRVVGLVVEAKRTAVVEVDGELVGESTAEDVGGSGHLLLHDAVVLLLLGGSLQSLPRELATEEVHEDVTERLEVVTTGLLDTKVGVDRGVTGSSGEVLVLTVGDVQVRLGVTVLLGETKVDHVDLVSALADAHQEVVGLDVTVNEVARVNVLDARDQLVGEKENGLERELAVAEVEQILEGRTTARGLADNAPSTLYANHSQKVEDHGIVVALSSVPTDKGNADTSGKRLVDLGLVLELRVLGLDGLELDGDLLTGDDVDTKVDVT